MRFGENLPDINYIIGPCIEFTTQIYFFVLIVRISINVTVDNEYLRLLCQNVLILHHENQSIFSVKFGKRGKVNIVKVIHK